MCNTKYVNSSLVNGSFYHIFNRGVEKRTIFTSTSEYYRFLQTLDFYRFYPTPRKLSTHLRFNTELPKPNFSQKELVKILCFCLMPNHFHLLLQQLEENGASEFLRRMADSYTRYFNTKNKRVGPLFQGTFKAKIIKNDEYLLQVSKYIHRNPVTLSKWNTKVLSDYTFSSYPGYLNSKRNFQFCDTETISKYFSKNPNLSYQSFVEEKEGINTPGEILIDIDDH